MALSGNDQTSFYDGLVANGLIVPVQPLGVFGRGAVFEDVLERVDQLILRTAKNEALEFMTFPPVIDRAIVERTAYMDSFPNLCGTVHSFTGHERAARTITE